MTREPTAWTYRTADFTIVNELPPSHRVGRPQSQRWLEVAAACRANPGSWVMVPDVAATVTGQITRGVYAAFRPAGAYEARIRNMHGRRGDLYIRFTGQDAS